MRSPTQSGLQPHIHLWIILQWTLTIVCLDWALTGIAYADLSDELKSIVANHEGDVAVAIKHLETGESFVHRPNEVMPTASLIKFPVLVELYRQAEAGQVSLDRAIVLKEEDKVPGSGILTDHFQSGDQLSLETAARLMMRYSDNTATNLVLDQIGIASVAKSMREMGLPETQIHAKVFRRETSIALDRSQKYGLGSTTAMDMLTLLERLHRKQIGSDKSCSAILAHLASCDDHSKLKRFLPKTAKLFHKTGAVSDVRTDAGLLETDTGRVAIVVLTAKNKDTSWGEENAAEVLCGKIAQVTWDWFRKKDGGPTPNATELDIGSTGELVETLQRLLNTKLAPSPGLTVDGDFGSMTAKAVRQFQESNQIPATGKVDARVWEKLGPIPRSLSTKEPVLPPLAPIEPMDPLVGRPFVSCKAWVIVNGENGAVVDGYQESTRLDFASTTKMMTAWLIAKAAEKEPAILEEQITYSVRADNTVGSTSEVKAGETLTVREALYGLLLPSGNDASVAFAEHFGDRLCSKEAKGLRDPLEKFVHSMNEEAVAIGMIDTQFSNPHGLTHPNHRSSCVDLARLAKSVIASPLLKSVVGTREYRCVVKSVTGYQREIVWRNTNQLLGVDGYLGVKTGTTDAAGACLVSCSQRDGKQLFVVVLGSAGSAARYSDSRNLHRWGWSQVQP